MFTDAKSEEDYFHGNFLQDDTRIYQKGMNNQPERQILKSRQEDVVSSLRDGPK